MSLCSPNTFCEERYVDNRLDHEKYKGVHSNYTFRYLVPILIAAGEQSTFVQNVSGLSPLVYSTAEGHFMLSVVMLWRFTVY